VLPDSPIKTLADLKDKKLGVQSMGSAGTTFARAFVHDAGLDSQKDITFLPIGLGAQAITSIRQNWSTLSCSGMPRWRSLHSLA